MNSDDDITFRIWDVLYFIIVLWANTQVFMTYGTVQQRYVNCNHKTETLCQENVHGNQSQILNLL